MRISDWSSDVCSSDLIPFIWSRIDAKWHWFWLGVAAVNAATVWFSGSRAALVVTVMVVLMWPVVERSFRGGLWLGLGGAVGLLVRSEENTSEIQSLMRISYAVFCLNKKRTKIITR